MYYIMLYYILYFKRYNVYKCIFYVVYVAVCMFVTFTICLKMFYTRFIRVLRDWVENKQTNKQTNKLEKYPFQETVNRIFKGPFIEFVHSQYSCTLTSKLSTYFLCPTKLLIIFEQSAYITIKKVQCYMFCVFCFTLFI